MEVSSKQFCTPICCVDSAKTSDSTLQVASETGFVDDASTTGRLCTKAAKLHLSVKKTREPSMESAAAVEETLRLAGAGCEVDELVVVARHQPEVELSRSYDRCSADLKIHVN
ncbi:hypothetical protein Y032_0039g157 [Ancylostoma ceylanicum]|uniref:Uncharacterized protein n=1 Tax=Ancylostoma ceylanicum TaxID=53326 RepID=A0A016UIW3_9BILA|nr:hypothetical protein Y032_0039g157 [Ancylostoma ceylanicum]